MALSKYTILVADYIPTDMMLLKIQLNRLHSRLLFATDGFEVIASSRKKCPDLILMDLYMPEISGFEVADVLAQQEYTRKIPIIYIVNMGDYPIYTPDGRLLSQKEYIEKPFDMRQLVKRILQWLAP